MTSGWRSKLSSYKNYIFIVLLAFLTLRVMIPQLDDLRQILSSLDTANIYWIILGIFVFFLSVPISTLQYMVLALKPIVFSLTFKVQMAVLFVSKLLPQGVGAIGLNVYYLVKKGHTPSQAASVMTIDGITSGIAYLIMLIIALSISPLHLTGLTNDHEISVNLFLFIVILLLGIIYFIFRSARIRARTKKAWKDLKSNFGLYRSKKLDVLIGGICNGLSSLTSIFVLWAAARAFGIDLSISGALISYTLGNIAATLIPTPGGIGAVEAGIYSGLVLVGVVGPDATLITLVYRLITYWIPILPGYFYFWRLRKDLLADYRIKPRVSS